MAAGNFLSEFQLLCQTALDCSPSYVRYRNFTASNFSSTGLEIIFFELLEANFATIRLSQDAQFQADSHLALNHMVNVLRSAVALRLTDNSGKPIPMISGTTNQLQIFDGG